MFDTKKVSAYLNNFSGIGEDDKKELKLSIYVTPITYELASEVSPQLADRLFRKSTSDEWAPAAEIAKTSFMLGQLDPQRVTFHPHDDEKLDMYGVLIENARVSNIEARKAFPDKPDFRLEFQMTVPMDESSMGIIRRYYKEKFFLSTEPMQPMLFDSGQIAPGQIERCQECSEPASWQDIEKQFFCQKHVRLGRGDMKLIVRTETPKEAEARALKEKAAERAAKGEEAPVEDLKDPKIAQVEEINRRASKKKNSILSSTPEPETLWVGAETYKEIEATYSADLIPAGKIRSTIQLENGFYYVATGNASSDTGRESRLHRLYPRADWPANRITDYDHPFKGRNGESFTYEGIAVKCKRDAWILGPDSESIIVFGPKEKS